MSIGPIEAIGGFRPMIPQVLPVSSPTAAAPKADAVGSAPSADFGTLLSQGIENLQGLHDRADQLAVQAATGDLNAIHDYTITATEAGVATQLTTAVRNKALEAFQEIMRMSI